MSIIAIDPSTTRIGVCWLHDDAAYHAFSIKLDGKGLLERMMVALKALPTPGNVEAVYVENAGSFFGRKTNYATLSALGMMRGAILAHYIERGVGAVALVNVSTVRTALCGRATASKEDVQAALR